MPSAGYNSTVKITGTSTAMVAEATTELVADSVFQITNAARRIIDPETALVVLVNGIANTAGVVDYLFGKVTFSTPLGGADVVTITGSFLPTLDVIECRDFNAAMARDLGDSTVFKSTPNRTKLALLKDASGSIGHLKALLDDLDAGGGTVKLSEVMANGVPKVLELGLGSSGYVFRALMLFDAQEVASAVADLVNATLNWQATLASNGRAIFGFGVP